MTIIDTDCVSIDTTRYVVPKPIVHDQKVTIHHWQLRDLLITHNEHHKHELIVPTGQDIFRYNYKTGQKSYLLKDIGYAPTCMASGYGYWAGGGQRGDLTLKDTNSDYQVSITTSPGCTINNGLCFSQLNGEIRLLVSNNDASIRIYSVPDLEIIDTLDYRTAVNHTSVSPDGRKMIAVGDDNRVQLFNVTNTGHYELVTTMAVSRDANFSVAWNKTSDKFAVSSQDGSVHVWDIRNRNPLAKFSGLHPSITKGAARCVKFSQTGAVDLLAFTEHVSHVHVIDARTFDGQQTVRVGSDGNDTPITGLCFSLDSQKMFVGLENAVLDFNIDTGSRRRFASGSLL
ncbi:WD40-repeat-containing domain protein [Gilbertella persicaria]|uniref:WD40-repeat-containing domain protein n=1 Tax=Gilbertella persicaria TaxID=101096 RepID=UPI00221EE787|nr:WD40-repeat-containing domain protein [Gilbertella persicaria]KAI8075867.1 WD40-repeat-containing domain protein [Gilbertella persicaria]